MDVKLYLDKLQEVSYRKPKYFYHSDSFLFQNLKVLEPRFPKTASTKELMRSKGIFASEDKAYASCFGLNYSGWHLGKEKDEDAWTIEIPEEARGEALKPCSIYIVSSKGFEKVPKVNTPEWVSFKSVKVIKEEKYNTCIECMENNGVIVKFL